MWNNRPNNTVRIAIWLKLTLMTSLATVSTTVGQQDYAIDNSHSSVVFSISHFRIGYIYGRFNKCSGQVVLDRFNPTASSFRLQVETQSIDTNNSERDAALRSAKFFDAAKELTGFVGRRNFHDPLQILINQNAIWRTYRVCFANNFIG